MMRSALSIAGMLAVALSAGGCQLWQADAIVMVDEKSRHELDSVRTALKVDAWRHNKAWSPVDEWKSRKGKVPAAQSLRWTFAPQQPEAKSKSLAESSDAVESKALAALENAEHAQIPEALNPSQKPDSKTGAHESKDEKVSPPTDDNPAGGNTTIAAQTGTAEKPADKTEASDTASGEPAPPESQLSTATWDGFWPLSVEKMVAQTGAESGAAVGDERILDYCLTRLAEGDDLAGWNAAILWARLRPEQAEAVAPILERLVVDPPRYNERSGKRSHTIAALEHKNRGDVSKLPSKKPAGPAANAVAGWQKLTGVEEAEAAAAESGPVKSISNSMRLAAAEAWCLVLAHSEADPVDGLAPAGRLLERTDLPNDLRAELFRGSARWVEPSAIPRIENALREGEKHERAPDPIRRAAVEACLIHALWNSENKYQEEIWPSTIDACRLATDAHIRSTYVAWLVASRHPDAFQTLKAELHDVSPQVRAAALTSLGELRTDAARNEIRAHVERSRDLARAAAVRALANWGIDEIAPFARDDSYAVRRVVAEELARIPSVESALILQELLIDSNSDVQQAALAASAGWPDTLAIPLLLQGMRDGAAETRRDCFERLAERRNVGKTYRFDASREERTRIVAEIVRRQNLPTNYVNRISNGELRNAAKVDEMHVAEIRGIIAAVIANAPTTPEFQAAVERLRGLGTADVPLVEKIMLEDARAIAAAPLREALAQLSPAHAALADLEHNDISVRRKGATALAQLGQSSSLSPAVVRRIRERITQEQDRVVWRSILTAVAADSSEEASEIALLAVNHAWPDIRTLGCEYVEHHGQPREALWLLPLLGDRNKTVQLAAVKALGNCHNPVALDGLPDSSGGGHRGLRELLSNPDKTLQYAAVASMSRLGDPQGMQELVRMSYHQSAQIREEAVRQMGLTGQSRFVGHLISLAWTESHDSVRRSILVSLEQLVPQEKRPAGLSEATGYDARIRIWAAWWQA